MNLKNRITFFCCLFCCMLAAVDFSGKQLNLHGKAQEKNGVITLDGKSAYVTLKGTEDWNITPSGLSFGCAVKLTPPAVAKHKKMPFNMVFSKGNSNFIAAYYGRNGMYTNIWSKKTKKSAAPMIVNFKPEFGTWFYMVVTFEHHNDVGQGDVGYITTLYINGSRIGRQKHQGLIPAADKALLEIGKGWGGPWFMCGQVGEIRADKRVWTEDEIASFTDNSKLVNAVSAKKVNPALDKYKAFSPAGKWYLQSLHRLPAKRGVATAEKLKKAFSFKDGKAFIREAKKLDKELYLVVKPEVLILFDRLSGQGEPLLGMYDRASGKSVLEDQLFGWKLQGVWGRKKRDILSAEQNYRIVSASADKVVAVWQVKSPVKLEVKVVYTLEKNGLGASLAVKNQTDNFLLTRVTFPQTRTPRLGKDDAFLYPFQCGALVHNPTKNSFKRGQNGRYPGNSMTMQFSAYYGDGRGVFLGWEDPIGTVKDFQATGKRNGMEFQWEQNAVIPLDKVNGGNDYASPGKVVFRTYAGKWFEACQMHKAWAVNKSAWKMTLPRKNTPKWYLDIPVNISLLTPREDLAKAAYAQLMYLRKYLDLPVFSSVYGWQDSNLGSWPVFRPKKFIPELFRNMQAAGCYPEPYTDPMLWDVMDGPNRKSDWRWSSHGKKFAVKHANGDIPFEHYAGGTQYGVMCPNSSGWRRELENMIMGVSKLTNAIYHDELMTVQGYCCWDKSHGHPLNDPAGWLTRGFRPMYEKFRKVIPGSIHASEEVSEPWLDLFDSGHVWRWTFNGQIPAFQAVYGGRIQYTSLNYDSHSHGSYASNFAKMANQLVTGQKLGRFYPGELEKADAKRLFLKKLAHLRWALNDYFNAGDMLSPVEFARPLPLMTTAWGTSLPQTEDVTLPKVASGSYRLKGTDIFIFINSTNSVQTVEPKISGKALLCAEGASKVVPFNGKVILKGYQSAVIVKNSRKEAERLQKTLLKISKFDAGEDFSKVFGFKEHRLIKPVPGKIIGADMISGYYNCSKFDGGKYFCNFTQGSLISYGTVDFGKKKVSEIYLTTAVAEHYAGGQIEVLTGPHQNMTAETLAVFTVPSTGGWENFREFKVKLTRPVSGKTNLVLRFSKTGCCNFAGWRFL